MLGPQFDTMVPYSTCFVDKGGYQQYPQYPQYAPQPAPYHTPPPQGYYVPPPQAGFSSTVAVGTGYPTVTTSMGTSSTVTVVQAGVGGCPNCRVSINQEMTNQVIETFNK